MIRSKILITALFFMAYLSAVGQRFSYLTPGNGLSQSSVKAICQDYRGFMWFGTADGLNKYDGYSFRVYKNDPDDPHTISGNDVSCICENQADSSLWIGTQDAGLNCYDRRLDRFLHSGKSDPSGVRYIRDLIALKTGVVLAALDGKGIYRAVKNDSLVFLEPVARHDILRGDVNCFSETAEGEVWIGTTRGLYKWGREEILNGGEPVEIRNEIVNRYGVAALEYDRKGYLWIGTISGGMLRYNQVNGSFSYYISSSDHQSLPSNSIRDILETSDGRIMIATTNGTARFLPERNGFIAYNYSALPEGELNDNDVYILCEDRSGILWLGTSMGGVNKLDRIYDRFFLFSNFFRVSENEIRQDNILSVAIDDRNNVWLSTSNGIVTLPPDIMEVEERQNRFRHLFTGETTGKVFFSKSLGLIADIGGKIYRVENNQKTTDISAEITRDIGVYSSGMGTALDDSDGDTWLSTAGGLVRYDASSGRFSLFKPLDSLRRETDITVLSIFEDNAGFIWLGTWDGKIFRFNRHTEELSPVEPEEAGKRLISFTKVFSITETQPAIIWLGTDKGLYRYDTHQREVTRYLEKDGLANNFVYSVMTDKSGNIWCSTNKGVSCFNPETGLFRNFSNEAGILNNEFNQEAYAKSASGIMYMGGVKGLIMFDPENIKTNKFVPEVVITGMEINYRPATPSNYPGIIESQVSEIKSIVLPHRYSDISFEFTALSYSLPELNNYKYILEGYDDQWVEIGKKRTAEYTNLNPGEYTFRVMASNNDGVWSKAPAEISITILPPFWLKAWFIILMSVAILSSIYLVFYLRLRRVKAHAKKLAELIKEKTLDLSEKNRMIEEQTQARIRFFTSLSHEFRNPLTLILTPLKELAEGMSKMTQQDINSKFRTVYANSSRLLLMVNELLDFRKVETDKMELNRITFDFVVFVQNVAFLFNDLAIARKFDYSFVSKHKRLDIRADREKLERVLFNLLSNAFKNTPDSGTVTIELDTKTSGGTVLAVIKVSDNGIGIDEEKIPYLFEPFHQLKRRTGERHPGTGLGLALSKKYAELHGGSISVVSARDAGSTFILEIPVNNDDTVEKPDKKDEETKPADYLKASIGDYYLNESSLPVMSGEMKKPLLLLIEDDPDMRSYLAGVLAVNYRVFDCADAENGLIAAGRKRPDLVICDVVLPDRNGFDFTRELKENFRTSHIPVILLTASTDSASMIAGVKAGADAYITKPFDLQYLVLTVESILTNRKKVHDKYRKRGYELDLGKNISHDDRKFIEKAVACVEKNMHDVNFDVLAFCREMNYSQPQAYRKIKALTNLSISEFIRDIRLKKASRMLRDKSANIKEVAYAVGFNDPNYFTKSYIKLFGKKPSDYLRED